MAKAKIKLNKSESYNSPFMDQQWRRGEQRVVTDDKLISYYKNQPEFSVSMLTPEAPPPVTRKAVAVVEDEPDDEVGPEYTEKDLKRQSKDSLIDLAAEDFDLDLDKSMKQSEMIKAILKAQKAKSEG